MNFAWRYLFAMGLWLLSLNATAATFHHVVLEGVWVDEDEDSITYEYETPSAHPLFGDLSDIEFLPENVEATVDLSQLDGEVFVFHLQYGLDGTGVAYGVRKAPVVAPTQPVLTLRELALSKIREVADMFCEKFYAPEGSLEKITGWLNKAQDPSYSEDRVMLNLMAIWIALQGDPNFNGEWSSVATKSYQQQSMTANYFARVEQFMAVFPRPIYFRGFLRGVPKLYDSPLEQYVWRARASFLSVPPTPANRYGMRLDTKCRSQLIGGRPSPPPPPPEPAPLMIERTRMRRR